MHKRQAIREALQTLITGLTTTGSNVFVNRFYSFEASELPAWVIITGDEESTIADTTGLERRVQIEFIGIARAQAGQNLDNTLDTMAEELELVLLKNATSELDSLILQSAEREIDNEDVDAALGQLTITYEGVYFTDHGAPSA